MALREVIDMPHGHLYDDEREMQQHTEAIRHIAQRYQDIPQERVTRLYEFVLQRYKTGARIKDFLAVLACRRVEGLLQKWSRRIIDSR